MGMRSPDAVSERTRAYRRDVRRRVISRKKHIVAMRDGLPYYHVDGKYAKGKIHCGCGLCKFGRKYGLPTFKEVKMYAIADDEIAEFLAGG